jgi:hypothetical protein
MASKRELIEPHKGDKRYARRNPSGQFKEMGRCRPLAGRGSADQSKSAGKTGAG